MSDGCASVLIASGAPDSDLRRSAWSTVYRDRPQDHTRSGHRRRMSCLLGESEEALRRGPLTCCLWSGRRDSNPRPQPWQSDQSLRWRRLEPHKSSSERCASRPRPPQSLHPAAVDVTMDVTNGHRRRVVSLDCSRAPATSRGVEYHGHAARTGGRPPVIAGVSPIGTYATGEPGSDAHYGTRVRGRRGPEAHPEPSICTYREPARCQLRSGSMPTAGSP